MNSIKRIFGASLLALAASFSLSAQLVTLTATTTTAAVSASDSVIPVTSATGISAPSSSSPGSVLYIISPGNPRGEQVVVQAVNSTNITVSRGRAGTQTDIPSGAAVIVGTGKDFRGYDPSGGCTTAITPVTPWINTQTGAQWLCSTITLSWVPGWGNTAAPIAATATVASAAGTITPSGPLFTVSGTAAITGFVIPVGFSSGSFTVIPTGAFTWTTAGNIGLAGTAVVGRALTFTWHQTASKWYPSYV